MQALILAVLLGASPRAVAVLDLGARGAVPRDLAQTLSEILAIEVRRVAKDQRVFGSEDIKALVGFKQQKALLGCEDTACLAELGGALGAQELVTGSLSQIADEYVLVLRRLDVTRAQVIGETTVNVALGSAKKLEVAVRTAVAQLYGVAAPPPEVEAAPTPRAHVWPWVLGAGALAAAGVSVWGYLQYSNFASDRSQSASPTTAVLYLKAQQDQSQAQTGVYVGIASLVVAAGLGVGAVFTW